MGIEHRFKESEQEVKRCPKCGYISTVKIEAEVPYVSVRAGEVGPYFVCKNFECSVERIYTNDVVVIGE